MRKFFILFLFFFALLPLNSQVIINDYTVWGIPGGTTTFNPSGDLTVNDTLIIYGNLYLDIDEDLTISTSGVLIVIGDFDAKNKVDLGLGGYFIVTGDFNKNGGQGDITDNGGEMFIFDDTPEWGPGNQAPDVDFGDEEDIVNDPIFDFFEEIIDSICNISISGSTITNASCEGVADGAVNITVTGVINPPPVYSWSNGATSEDISGVVAGWYKVIVYKGFCFDVDSFEILTNPLPDDAGSISGATNVCIGSNVTYTVPAIANATSYVWSANNGATGTSTTNSITFTFPNSGATTISVYGVNACGSGVPSTLDISVNAAPAASIITGNTTTCTGNTGEVFTVTNNAAWAYSWSIEDNVGTIQGASNTNSITVNWKVNAEVFTGPYASDAQMIRTVTSTVNFNPANGCPAILEWEVTLYRLPETGPQYHIHNQWND
ncbi:MAG: hypothetical protein R6X09_04160 [Bacteroidales bacterium]